MTTKLALLLIGADLVGATSAEAQKNTTVCWGEFETTCKEHPYETHFQCGSGGNSGINPDYVCQTICNKPQGQGCTYQRNNTHDGNNCGYTWATIRCFGY